MAEFSETEEGKKIIEKEFDIIFITPSKACQNIANKSFKAGQESKWKDSPEYFAEVLKWSITEMHKHDIYLKRDLDQARQDAIKDFSDRLIKDFKSKKSVEELTAKIRPFIQQARQETLEEFENVIWRKIDWIQLLSKAINNRKTSWKIDPVIEWRNASDEIRSALVTELINQKVLPDRLKEDDVK